MPTTDKSLRDYFLIAYLLPLVAVVYTVTVYGLEPGLVTTQLSPHSMIVVLAMVHAPSIAALIVVGRDEGIAGVARLLSQLKQWRFSWRWYASALLLIPGAILLSLLVASEYSPAYAPGFYLGILTVALLAGALWEEIGWTGYATPRLLARYGALTAALLLGLLHALWHLPADYWGARNFYESPWMYAAHFGLITFGIVLLRVITVWIYVRTRSLVLGWLTHYGYSGGQLLLVPLAFSPVETVRWNTVFVLVLLFVVAMLAMLNLDFRQVWSTSPRESDRA